MMSSSRVRPATGVIRQRRVLIGVLRIDVLREVDGVQVIFVQVADERWPQLSRVLSRDWSCLGTKNKTPRRLGSPIGRTGSHLLRLDMRAARPAL